MVKHTSGEQIVVSSTSGKSCTVCLPGKLPEYHRQTLDEVERLRDIIKRVHEGDPDDLYTEGMKLS